jgi:UDP-glucose 4-epimerase
LFFYRAQYGIDYLALRYSNVYGPRQDPHGEAGVVAIFSERILAGKRCTIFGEGKPTRDYVYVGDVVRANVRALGCSAAGMAVNIGTGIETSTQKLYEELAQVAGEARPPEYAPIRPGEQLRSAVSPARAERELGWRPATDLRAGLAQTFAYFRQQRK